MGWRAFIGPLGDDIPSIFPIIIGVMLFIGAMLFSANLIDQKNAFIDLRKAAVTLAYSATERGLYTAGDFDEKCAVLDSQARANRVFFALTIKNYCSSFIDFAELSADEVGVKLLDPRLPDPANPGLKCWIGKKDVPPEPEPSRLPRDAVVFNYPVGVECAGDRPHRGLGLLNLVVWRQRPGAPIPQ
jgi:hypothetical protein